MFSQPTGLLLLVAFFSSSLYILFSALTVLITNGEKPDSAAAEIFLASAYFFVLVVPVAFAFVVFPTFTKCLLAVAAIIAVVSLAQRIGDRYLANTYRRAGA